MSGADSPEGADEAVRLETIVWRLITQNVGDVLRPLREQVGEKRYIENRDALREYLVAYFNSSDGCTRSQGKSIRPCGATKGGAKILKVRWAVPGGGKSGGLRLGIADYCTQRRVVLGFAMH